jgi:hypothetical protein
MPYKPLAQKRRLNFKFAVRVNRDSWLFSFEIYVYFCRSICYFHGLLVLIYHVQDFAIQNSCSNKQLRLSPDGCRNVQP